MSVKARGDRFEIVLNKEQVAELNAQMVAMGIRVYEMKTVRNTLEDRFLEMTRGDSFV
jgi:hypothetical protein